MRVYRRGRPAGHWSLVILLGLLAAGLTATACSPTSNEAAGQRVRTLKVATVLPDSHPTVQALHYFASRLKEVSDGRMRAVVFPSSQLGSADEAMDGCRTGDVQVVQTSAAMLAEYVPLANVLSMPFIFRDSEHQAKVLDGEVGEAIRQRTREVGLELLGFMDSGTRNVTTKRGPIEKPEDLRGLKIRVMDAKLMVDTINAMGASAVAMNQGDVFTALQQGLLDGWENNPQTVVNFRMYDTGCIYFAWTHHLAIPDVLLTGTGFFESLSEQEQGWLRQAMDESCDHQRREWKAETEKALADMTAHGMKINEVDTAPFASRMEPIYEAYYRTYGEEFKRLCEQIRSAP